MDTPLDWTLAAAPPAPAELAWEPLAALRAVPGQHDAELADCRGKRIGILIVTYNAVSTLANVLRRITPQVWKNVEEIAVFDDASQDATYDLAVGMKTLWLLPKLRVLRHPRNLGYGGNQKAGFRYFMEKGFDIVILLHGDGQYAPEILAHLYHPIVAGQADAVFGSRMLGAYGGALRGGMPFYKYVGNRILSAFENRALGMHLSEFHSGYRAYSLDALRRIDLAAMSDDFHFDTQIIIKLQHQRYAIREVPIPTYYGSEICHVNGLRYARNVLRAVRRYRETCRSVARHAEFQEYFTHYPLKLTRYSSHDYARRMMGSAGEVLDVGCGQGFFAAELKKDGHRVTGIDSLCDPERADALDQYLRGDLQRGLAPLIRRLRGKRFHRILFLDVLEHLRRPGRLLFDCRQMLEPGGAVVISLPNVANFVVRLQLLFGRFEYTERGILDRTHLRFFTRNTARRLLQESGYRVLEEETTVIPLDLALGLPPGSRLHWILNRGLAWVTSLLPGLFGYQMMFLAKPDDAVR
jgi:2-polyprenyl-3-methyl-5-hydroxy-6-metoxy-1,4-benzoquinol methylase